MSQTLDENNLLVALDIGSSKIIALAARYEKESSQIEILAAAEVSSGAIKKGLIIDVESAVQSIQTVISEIEDALEQKVCSVSVSISGAHIKGVNTTGVIALGAHRVIDDDDVQSVIKAAKSIPVQDEDKILHVLLQNFSIDSSPGVNNPVGLTGRSLEAWMHLITVSLSAAQNIVHCIHQCGIEIEELMFQPLSAALAVLSEDERQLGSCLVDCGAGTTGLAVFKDASIYHSCVIPIGAQNITNDIAIALQVPIKAAEAAKTLYGRATWMGASEGEQFYIPSADREKDRLTSTRELTSIIQPRIEELLEIIHIELAKIDTSYSFSVVLTGGGAMMKEILPIAQSVLQRSVRVGFPRYEGSFSNVLYNPCYATVYGLLWGALFKRQRGGKHASFSISALKGFLRRMKRCIQTTF